MDPFPFFNSLTGISIGAISLASILSAVVVLILCAIAARIVNLVVRRVLGKSRMEKGLRTFLCSAVKVVLWIISLMIVAETLGIPTTSLVALLGIAGLALSLSVQGLMSNLFSGLTILGTKPFLSGDFVEFGGVSGTVEAIGLFYTRVMTGDNNRVYVPNKDVAAAKITNFAQESNRRVDLSVTVGCDTDSAAIRAACLDLIAGDSRVLQDPAPFVGLEHIRRGPALQYVIRVWCRRADYWDVYFALNEGLVSCLRGAGIELK